MLDTIWNFFQQVQIQHLDKQTELHGAKHQGHELQILDSESRLRELEQRHEQLKLVTLSLWSLLRDHSGLMESDLKKYVEEIDLLDGKKDGKVDHSTEKVQCNNCNRIYLTTSLVCPWCGNHNSHMKPFAGT